MLAGCAVFNFSLLASILNVANRLMCVWTARHIAIRYIVVLRAFFAYNNLYYRSVAISEDYFQ